MNELPPFTLRGRAALVTGSSQGIGYAVGDALRAAGARVVYHREDYVRAPISPDSLDLPKDLLASEAPDELVSAAFEEEPGLDLAVCNAGGYVEVPFLDSLGEPGVALRFAKEDGLPDGCAMNVEGNLWIAHWEGAKVTQWDVRTKRLLRTVHLPVRYLTSCAFGGPRRDRLYITTATEKSAGENEPHAGAVFQGHPNTVGLELACFAGE